MPILPIEIDSEWTLAAVADSAETVTVPEGAAFYWTITQEPDAVPRPDYQFFEYHDGSTEFSAGLTAGGRLWLATRRKSERTTISRGWDVSGSANAAVAALEQDLENTRLSLEQAFDAGQQAQDERLSAAESAILHPSLFGAMGAGGDDTAALQAWINAGGRILPPGTYRLSAALIVPVGSLRGAGMGATRLIWTAGAASSGITVTAGTNTRPTTVASMSLETEANGVGTALLVDYSGNIGGGAVIQPRTAARLRVRDVQMKGSGTVTNTGWLHHLDMVSVVGAHIQGCAVEGRGSGGALLSQTAYRFRGAGAPVECVIDGCWAYQVQDAVYSAEAEGLFVLGCNFVAVGRGVAFTSTGAEPQCQVSDTHINAYVKCVDLDQCAQGNIHDNLLYSRNDTTNEVIGVDVSPSCLYNRIEGNTFVRTGTSTLIAVRDAGDRTVISGNIIQTATVGIDILAAARSSAERNNRFISCGTDVRDGSTTTTRGTLIRGYAGPLDALANAAANSTSVATLGAGVFGVPVGAQAAGAFVRTSVFDVNAAHQEFDDHATERQFYRRKKSGVWGPWLRVSALPAAGPQDLSGTGTPEGAVAAPVGSTFRRTDGGAGTSFYVKESGTGSSGWVAK